MNDSELLQAILDMQAKGVLEIQFASYIDPAVDDLMDAGDIRGALEEAAKSLS